MKTSNNKAREYVQRQIPFQGSNTYGERFGESYVVYSYGRHWPLFIFHEGHWYANKNKYSRTTSKHHGQLHPLGDIRPLATDEMIQLRDRIENETRVIA